jgi:UDPglucose 6-dehydrogenase
MDIFDMFRIGIIGHGFVGSAIHKSLELHICDDNLSLFIYDKYKSEPNLSKSLDELLLTDILFLCLPTLYDKNTETYDLTALNETIDYLSKKNYKGICLIKSTILPNTTLNYFEKYPNLKLIHNPEFLSAKTAFEDFHNQKHIVLGITSIKTHEYIDIIINFYKKYYPDTEITIITSTESELMKLSANSFYSIKIQFFTEIYLLCKKLNCSYETVKQTLLNNGWINPMHTNVPGPDGNISYGGMCFPKDISALQKYMEKIDTPNEILKATINERNIMRID